MSRRALHWLVLGFTTLWFGVLVPVHNRGEMAVAGAYDGCAEHDTAAAPVRACHRVADAPPAKHGHCPDQGPDSAPRPGRACAVCFFIAGLDAPPPVSLIETRLGLVGVRDNAAPRELPAFRITLPFHSRAPPTA